MTKEELEQLIVYQKTCEGNRHLPPLDIWHFFIDLMGIFLIASLLGVIIVSMIMTPIPTIIFIIMGCITVIYFGIPIIQANKEAISIECTRMLIGDIDE